MTYLHASAAVSDDELYRYELVRTWAHGPAVLWVMLNPSTADGQADDPTIRRCVGFTRRWGYGAIVVVNLFALRTTRPVHLLDHPEPIGPENDHYIAKWLMEPNVEHVVAAWGAHYLAVDRGREIADLVELAGRDLFCLGMTNQGAPRHPLYVRNVAAARLYDR